MARHRAPRRDDLAQANVTQWVDDILPLLDDGNPLGAEGFATHKVPLDEAPRAYETFQKKQDGAIKVLLQPRSARSGAGRRSAS